MQQSEGVKEAMLRFYDRFYRPEALTETQREHMARWHQERNGGKTRAATE